ncbi:MAG TPA: 2-oxo acid dehydrogenase subunit E2, partial [Chloroflexota bacterium]|nr:2-oxo acid dehydrogenase subunit E2 [Chloroflexota bacterium]
ERVTQPKGVTHDGKSVTDDAESVTPTVMSAKATPVAARLLAEHGLDASQLHATGRITKAAVLRYLEEHAPKRPPNVAEYTPKRPPNVEEHTAKGSPANVVPLSSMRKAIAQHMVKARQTIPMGQTVLQADLTDLATWRERAKSSFEQENGASLTYTVLFVHALACALQARQHAVAGEATHEAAPALVRGVDTGTTVANEQGAARAVDVGVAVALEAGLIVPVLRGADALSLGELARSVQDIAARARSGKIEPGETRGTLMTVTNVGSFGNLFASPIVPLEQIGIFGPGIVERRPMPTPDGGIRIGWRCWLTLMFDRRVFDDLAADRFLRSVLQLLLQLPQNAHRR